MSPPPDPVPPPPAQAIAARMRFEDPVKFLEFYEKQLQKSVVGLRHAEDLPRGTPIQVAISPPSLPDRLLLDGKVVQSQPRPDGSVRLRVEVRLGETDTSWLAAYCAGLRAGLEAIPEMATSVEMVPEVGPDPEQARSLSLHLDAMTYYQLLGVQPMVLPEALQTRFHHLTRQFHPDLYFGNGDANLLLDVNRVYRRMNEAYAVLKDPRRRKLYDRGLEGPPNSWMLRLSEEAEHAAQRQRRVRQGETPTGQFYWKLARDVLERARQQETKLRPALRESARLLRTALFFEPDNDHFRNALDHVLDRIQRREDD